MVEALKPEKFLSEGSRGGAVRAFFAAAVRAIAARKAEALSAGLLFAMAVNSLSVITRKSITTDEIIHIPAGYYHLVVGDFQYNNTHPPPPKMLSALPLLFIQPNEMPESELREARRNASFVFTVADHFWGTNDQYFQTISFWTRVPMIALTVLLGIVIFCFARRLFGERAAVLSVALFTLEPTVLAHGRVVHTDIASALGLLVFCFALYCYTSAPSLRRALWLGAATGLAPLTKFSMVALAPPVIVGAMALVVFAPRMSLTRRAALAHAGTVAVVSLLVINAAYFFHHRPLTQVDVDWIGESFPARFRTVLWSVRVLRHIVPTDFLMGIYWQLYHAGDGHPASLFGTYRYFGWWYYFPAAFALKTTIPFLLISMAAVCWSLWRAIKGRDRRMLFALAPFLIFTAYVMSSTIDIGVRYYLPAYSFLFIMSSALLDRLLRLRSCRFLRLAVVAIIMGWSAVEAARAYPDYMPYMNQLASARPHWWYLSDSNVEWGDDVSGLASFLRARGETKVRAALLGGYSTLRHYGVEYINMFVPPGARLPRTKYIAIGASFLNGSTVPPGPRGSGRETDALKFNFFDEYRRRTPEAVIGGSIYVFRAQ